MSFQVMINIFLNYWPMFLRGAGKTLLVAIVGTVVGSLIGLVIGVIRTIPMPEKGIKRYILKFVNLIIGVYIEVFRGTPMMVQAMVIFYGIPRLFDFQIEVLPAALLVISINTGSYMAEIVRGGIVSIDKGQYEAAEAIGMSHFQIMTSVVLPQAIRNILPATGNELIINIKDSSVLSVIGLTEVFFQSRSIAGANFMFFEVFTITSIVYLIMTITSSRLLQYVERKMDGPENYNILGNQMQVKTAREGRDDER